MLLLVIRSFFGLAVSDHFKLVRIQNKRSIKERNLARTAELIIPEKIDVLDKDLLDLTK